MKNTRGIVLLTTIMTVFSSSAYDSWTRIWHDDMVPNITDPYAGTWYTNTPDDPQAHIKAQREKERNEKKAHKKYQATEKRRKKGE